MSRNWIRRIIILLVVVVSLILFSIFMNKGNTDMTMEMQPASFPIAYMMIEEQKVNEMHGYAKRMNAATMRDSLTPIGEDRKLSFQVDLYEQSIDSVRFEVRNVDGTRLIEDTQVTDYFQSGNSIQASVSLKDLIEENVEYNFILILTLQDGREIYYYTRVIQCDNSYTMEKLDYILDFHQKTFDKEQVKEIAMYLEPNSDGDNSNFGNVDIHSNLNQVSWGELNVVEVGEPVINICELGKATASVTVQSIVQVKEGKINNIYRVQEFYRVRYTTERSYLLNYNRTMEELFLMEKSSFANNKIVLGIQKDDIQMAESNGGNILAFANAGRVYSYNASENKMAQLFAFFDQDHFDARTYYDCSNVKILDVEENGNVFFMVYGYMNRGTHEGEAGIEICYYNSLVNTIEEQIFIPYDKSPKILMEDLEKLAYVNNKNELFALVDGSIYKFNIELKTYEEIVSGLNEENFYVSKSNQTVVWQENIQDAGSRNLRLMNLNTEEIIEIPAGEGEYCKAIGFMNEDVVYGLANKIDVSTDRMGTILFPMKKLLIRSESGAVLKEYANENIYVLSGEINGNQLNLTRAEGIREEISEESETQETMQDGEQAPLTELIPITDDQITSNAQREEGTNKIAAAVTDLYETIQQIELKKEIDTKSLKFLTPKEVLYEGGRTVEIEEEIINGRYLVYTQGTISAIYSDPSKAVSMAYDEVGTVVDYQGNEIYKRGETVERNQIMAIEEAGVTEEKDSLAVCLDTILSFEGISRNTEFLLQQGQSAIEILKENLKDYDILNLYGCPMSAMLYYLNQDIPILAEQSPDSYVLIIGFNQQNVVLMEPDTGKIYKKGMNDSTEMFEQAGNHFVTYARLNQDH